MTWGVWCRGSGGTAGVVGWWLVTDDGGRIWTGSEVEAGVTASVEQSAHDRKWKKMSGFETWGRSNYHYTAKVRP